MDKIKARRRIKKHVRERGGRCDFEVTPQFVLFWWHKLNSAVFDNKLTPPKKIEIRNFRDCWGWCKTYKTKPDIVLGITSDMWDRKTFLTVLVHEMVHQHEHQTYKKMSHGQNFYYWQDKIKRNIGLSLSEYVDVD